MSAGVSDQRMKGQGNQVNNTSKHVEIEERSIPWSQQVDEVYENLSSPTAEGNQSGNYESSTSGGAGGTQFQNPPFNIRDDWSSNAARDNNPFRRTSSNDNYDNKDGSHGQNKQKSSSKNYFSGNGDYNSKSWSQQVSAVSGGGSGQQQQHQQNQQQHQTRRGSGYDNNSYRSERSNYNNDSVKSIQRGMQGARIDNNEDRSSSNTSSNNQKGKSANQAPAVPKQMTWASIASQPAKPTLRTSSTASTFKKKGPGMPPPPMVPGKHNMDIGTWDSPKNGPPVLVPPPPPPVVPVPIMDPSPLSQSKQSMGSNASNNGPLPGEGGRNSSGSGNNQSNQKPTQLAGNSNQQNSFGSQHNNANSQQHNNMRPPWVSQNTRSFNSGPHSFGSQNQRPNSNQWRAEPRGQPVGNNNSYHHGRSQQHESQNSHQEEKARPQTVVVSPVLINPEPNYKLLEELKEKNNYNPTDIDLDKAANARFFVIKSFSEDDVHRSIKYEIWCSTEHGNKRLDNAYRERQNSGGYVYLLFSVNSSGHFCGMAEMMSPVDYGTVSNVWSQDKWKGTFKVKWIYIKDVPNTTLRHIRLENNENKPVVNSRDTQEVYTPQGVEVLEIIHSFEHQTSIFDDFQHYELLQLQDNMKRNEPPSAQVQKSFDGPSTRYRDGQDYERGFDKGGYGGGGFRDREKSYGRNFNNFDNRRHDDQRSRYNDRNQRDGGDDGSSYGHNRENSGGDFHNRGFHRGGDFGRNRDDRGGGGGYNNRDRDNYGENSNNGRGDFMNRGGDGQRGYRDFNRDRGDHHNNMRGGSRGPRTGGPRN